MNSTDLFKSIVAISIAVVVFSMLLLPMIQSAEETQITVTETADNATATDKYALTKSVIVLTYADSATTVTVGGETSTATEFITSAFRAVVSSGTSITLYGTDVVLNTTTPGTLTISGSTATVDYTDESATDVTYTLTAIASKQYVLMDDDTNGTYGLYTASSTNVYAYASDKIVAINSNVAYIGTAETLTADTSSGVTAALDTTDEAKSNLWTVTAGTVIAPVEYSYDTEQDALDDNMKALIEVIPIMAAVGMLLAAVGMFINKRY